MDPERWQRIQKLYNNVVELTPEECTPILDEACSGDPEMRREIESLLECEGKLGNFLMGTAIDVLARTHRIESAKEEPDSVERLIGTVIADRYVVKSYVGSGGMGDVYLAEHRLLRTPVAIKRLSSMYRDRPAYRQQFVEEARRAVLLDHPNVASVKDVVEQFDEVFVVMEFIDGTTLRPRLSQTMELSAFLDIAMQCASALAAAHRHRTVHLDIKPENIMLTAAGKVKVCDFGMARQLPRAGDNKEELPATPWTFGGTPAYMAPEVLESDRFDERADLFSLGVVFYEVLSGRHPFRSQDVESTTNRILREPTPPLQSHGKKLPPRLARLVTWMLSKDPDDRIGSADEVLNELRAIHRQQTLFKDTWRSANETLVQVSRNQVARVTLAVAVALGLGALLYFRPLSSAAPLPQKKHVIVLPFSGSDAEEARWGDSLSVLVTGKLMLLTTVPDLQVEPASEVRRREVETPEAARAEFGPGTIILAGTLQFGSDRLHVSYSLLDGTTLSELRHGSKTVRADTLALADAATRDIANMLELQLTAETQDALQVYGTSDPKAFFLYTSGLGYLSRYQAPENVDRAIDFFSQAVGQDPRYAEAYAELGRAYWQKFDKSRETTALYDLGQRACEKAASLDQGLSEASVCLGLLHNSKGDYEVAREKFEQAIALSPTNDDALRGLGLALEELQRYDDAEQAYLKAIELRPQYWACESWLAVFYNTRRHDYPKAIEHFKKALELSPANAQVYYSMADAYLNTAQYDLAIAAATESARLRPDLVGSWGNLGLIALRSRQYGKAIAPFEKIVSLKSDFRNLSNLARAYRLNARMDEARYNYELAIKQGETLLEQNPRDHGVHLILGRDYAMLGQTIPAVRHLEFGLAENRADPHYLTIAATAYVVLGDRKTALSLLVQAAGYGYTADQFQGEPELDALKNEPVFIGLMTPNIQGK